jgi:hypothetical protein
MNGYTIGYKKVRAYAGKKGTYQYYLLTLRILDSTPRVYPTGKRCKARCAKATVIKIEAIVDSVGDKSDANYQETKVKEVMHICYALNGYGRNITYKLNRVAKPNGYDSSIRKACGHGIHYFLSKEKARRY